MRASDADREQIVDRLRGAAAEGRIASHELEHRVGAALGAATYGELDATVADLPGPLARRRSAVRALREHPLLLVVAIPVVLVAVALVAAIALASVALGAALFLLGRRHAAYLGRGPRAMRRLGPPAGRGRRTPGYWA
jgi:hypothetical protein